VLATPPGWAASQQAARMDLQVERANPAALALYRRAGFHEICTHYRTARPAFPIPSEAAR
jgi:ribosomal protein S18 acetylase RimI-like enzyme